MSLATPQEKAKASFIHNFEALRRTHPRSRHVLAWFARHGVAAAQAVFGLQISKLEEKRTQFALQASSPANTGSILVYFEFTCDDPDKKDGLMETLAGITGMTVSRVASYHVPYRCVGLEIMFPAEQWLGLSAEKIHKQLSAKSQGLKPYKRKEQETKELFGHLVPHMSYEAFQEIADLGDFRKNAMLVLDWLTAQQPADPPASALHLPDTGV